METYDPAFEHTSPDITLETTMGSFAVNHYNSRLRPFKDRTMFNHIEFVTDEGKLMAVKLEPKQYNILKANNFPRLWMPFVDTATYDWYLAYELLDLGDSPPPIE